MKQYSLLLAALLVVSQAHGQDPEASNESEVYKKLNDAFKSRVEKKNPGLKLSSMCTGIFKVRAAVVKSVSAQDAINLSVFDQSKEVEGLYGQSVKVTFLDSVFRPKNDTHTKDILTDVKQSGTAFKTECWNVYENPVIRLKISNFKPSITKDGKTYNLKYVQLLEAGVEDQDPEKKKHGLYYMMEKRTYGEAKLIQGGTAGHQITRKRSGEFPKDAEISLESKSAAFSIDLLYAEAPVMGPPKLEKSKFKYNFPSCKWDVDTTKLTGIDAFDKAMNHNIANGYSCDIVVVGSASDTGVNEQCNTLLKEANDYKANVILSENRALAMGRALSGRYSRHGVITAHGLVNGDKQDNANSQAALDNQYIELSIENCQK